MKKIFLLAIVSFFAFSANAEQVVGTFKNSYLRKEYRIEAAEKDGKLHSVYIGVESDRSEDAFIFIDGKNLDSFKTSLELVRDKYLEWIKIAKENNVTEMNKEFDIKFPSVNIAWSNSKWWFSFGNTIKLKFIIKDNGQMIACWIPKVTASSNRYIDERIYFIFADEDDFNDLISQLDYQSILNQLLKTKDNENLFH